MKKKHSKYKGKVPPKTKAQKANEIHESNLYETDAITSNQQTAA